jgi:diamine N-acetyltransferase
MEFFAIDRHNWEEALKIKVRRDQKKFVPSVMESLACAYIKPWDEAFAPYLIKFRGTSVGIFYLSYTPDSIDNYWIGGFQIDKKVQGKGIGKKAFLAIISFVKQQHSKCRLISLTVEKSNTLAAKLYVQSGFITDGQCNRDDEMIYRYAF